MYADIQFALRQLRKHPGFVLRMIALEGAFLASVGVAAGAAGATVAAILIRKQLFGVHASDGVTWAAVLITLTFATGIAVGLPAWRAARILPLEALREE